MSNKLSKIGIAVVAVVLLLGCPQVEEQMPAEHGTGELRNGEPMAPPGEARARVAVAELQGREGTEITGTVSFTELPDGEIQVVAHVENVPGEPGLRGIHLHETGDCSAPDFMSAGDHFDPNDHPHGGPGDSERHAGDFGNIEIDQGGHGELTLTTELLTVHQGPRSVLGRAVILHERRDDLETQPTGDAGGRVACGVVEELPATPGVGYDGPSPS
jgi:superoxide dismutase, Cu-Zn family